MQGFRFCFRSTVLILSLVFLSCGNQKPVNSSDRSFSINTSACEGSCPVYSIIFHEKGLVEFSGMQHTMIIGDTSYQADSDDIRKLFESLESLEFNTLEESYLNTLYDLPETNMLYEGKQVLFNDERIIPNELKALMSEVQRLMKVAGLVD